jgi:hypothetical protein
MDDGHGAMSTEVLTLGHPNHVGPKDGFDREPFFVKSVITLGSFRKSYCISLLKVKDLWDLED